MKLIVISHPGGGPGGSPVSHQGSPPDEVGTINKLFENGLQILHLRKPDSTREQVKLLLTEIDEKYHSRISLHQYHSLAEEFGISRLHFTEKERAATSWEEFHVMRKKGITLSTSIHQIEQHGTLPTCFSYAFFGPVFDSISKKGYHGVVNGGFRLTKKPVSLIALGGIGTSNLENIQAMNFDGAAILGALWEKPEDAVINFCRLRDSLALLTSPGHAKHPEHPRLKPGVSEWQLHATSSPIGHHDMCAPGSAPQAIDRQIHDPGLPDRNHDRHIPNPRFQPGVPQVRDTAKGFSQSENSDQIARLHFISSQTNGLSHLQSIQIALEGGCKWIQLRVKDQAQEDVLPQAMKAKKLCDSYNAKLIINDFPLIAKEVRAYGLHLGLSDMKIPQAREVVGNEMIIGGTANTFEDIVLRIDEGADYVGLGPYRFTTTKQNLSPILGLDGYQKLMDRLVKTGHYIPIIAIGGIVPDDIAALKNTGIHGVAMSSALLQFADIKETVSKIKSTLC